MRAEHARAAARVAGRRRRPGGAPVHAHRRPGPRRRRRFDLVAFVLADSDADPPSHLAPAAGAPTAGRLGRTRPVSVAELAAELDLAVGVVRVLLGDLLAEGLVAVHEPPAAGNLPDDDILKAVVNGLRAL